jgi:hypothetical protein
MPWSFGLFPVAGLGGWISLAAILGMTPAASAAPPQSPRDFVRAERDVLDALFAAGSVGEIPAGYLPGRVIPEPGTRRPEAKSRRLGLVWRGKVFHGDGTAHNRVFGLTAVPMTVYHGTSWHDGGPAIIVDYADSWRIFRNVRDEIREVAPGLYLGRTFVTKDSVARQTNMFALQTADSRGARLRDNAR